MMQKTRPLTILEHPAAQNVVRLMKTLKEDERALLVEQLNAIDIPTLNSQLECLSTHKESMPTSLEPFTDFVLAGSQEMYKLGWKAIAEGKVACLIVAGGQGSRLRFDGPKGLYPISPVHGKTLFQIFAEKTLAAGKKAERSLPLAVMTSSKNHQQTVEFFQLQDYFGLDKMQIAFFQQGNLPLIDGQQSLFLETPSLISQGPDGNGVSLKHLHSNGIWQQWKEQGVEHVIFLQIDNPLADPFDSELVGIQRHNSQEATLKSIERTRTEEKVGVIVKVEGQLRVVEYSEIPPEEMAARSGAQLKHRGANISTFCFDMDFIEKIALKGYLAMPLHQAHKAVRYLTPEGKVVLAEKPMAWKFEKFIFDVLQQTSRTGVLLAPRTECHAPLKNFEGEGSVKSVQEALMARDRSLFQKIYGYPAPEGLIELPADLLY